MISLNFFRKAAKNILPFILIFVFLLGASAIAVKIYLDRDSYKTELEENQTWLATHAEDLELSIEMQEIDLWISQAVSVQETLQGEQFAMDRLTNELTALIPEEDERVISFQISEDAEELVISLENTKITEVYQIIGDLEDLSYVSEVQLLSMELLDENSQEYRFNMTISLDFEELVEENIDEN